MSTRKDAGMCLACGQEAKLRRSSCATKSGLDLFFCSKEHQRLVWPFHRLVCGERAHPFALPPFSAEEADYITDCIETPATSDREVKGQRMAFDLFGLERTEVAQLNAVVKSLVGKGGQMLPTTFLRTRAGDESILVMELRYINSCWRAERAKTLTEIFAHPIEYFNCMYYSITRAIPDITADIFTSTFCHHLAATIPMSTKLAEIAQTRLPGGQIIPAEEIRRLPGGSEVVDTGFDANNAAKAFLRTAKTPEHLAYARAILIEMAPPADAQDGIRGGDYIEIRR